jgi:tRNA(fMet)-specific endonuclease VapC
VEYELRYGLQRLPLESSFPRLAALAQLLLPMQMLSFESECAFVAALVATTALCHQPTLVTRNASEFVQVLGLLWVNWQEDG